MTNQEIKTVGQTIAQETQIGGNTAARVGGVVEGIGVALDNKDAANGYYQATISGGTITVNAPNYLLGSGGNLRIKMPSAGTGASTLTIGNANAVQLWYNGAAVSEQNTWEANEIISVFYDGTRFMASNSQGGGGKAEKIKYSNSQSGLASDDVQGALDEVAHSSSDIYKQTAKIEKSLESAFDIEVIDVESYNLNTASKGTGSRHVFGNVLTNDYAFDLKTIKLYCSTATSSFVIAIGEVDTEQSKYVINKSYRINKALTVGENVIDVSKYDIVIPPYALVACTGTTSYTVKSGNKMIGPVSTNEGAGGTYASTLNNYYMQFVLLGTITKYHSKDGIFKTGELVSEVKIKNDFSGGVSNVLSAEQGKKLNTQFTDLVSYSFNTETINVENPQISTETAGSGLSGTYWGTVLTNDTTIVLQSVKFYSDRALSAFKIAIGSANIEENTYHIDDCYTIQAGVSVGENSIDVSEYGITIPPKALAVCTAVFHYKTTNQGCYLIGRLSSIEAGTDGSYTTKYAASSTCVYIGTAKHYDIVIPESVLKVIGRSNILFGKKYTAIGDSFTFRDTAYPHIIGNRNNMSVLNQGESGSTLNGYITQGRYNQIPQDVNYITIWYGINDSGHRINIGTVNDQPESVTSETSISTCGGFNWFFKWLLTNRPLAHIGVIITDFTAQDRREAIMACCQKWGIPYLDLYDPTIPMIRTRGATRYTHNTSIAPLGYVEVCAEAKALRNTVFSTDPSSSNIHPNNTCHEWQSYLIENFLRSL